MKRTNKEIFDKIIEFMKFQKVVKGDIYLPYKHTKKQDFESYSFETGYSRYDLKKASEICKTNKWGPVCGALLDQEYLKSNNPNSMPNIYNEYTTILYDHVKDKISVSNFTIGYGWAHRKNRYYPIKINTPVYCMSKHFYKFNKIRVLGRRCTNQVRHWKGDSCVNHTAFHTDIANIILGINFSQRVNLTSKYYHGAKSIFEVIERALDCKIPKALHRFAYHDLYNVIKCLTNKNEVNTICQFLSKDKDYQNYHDLMINGGIYSVIAKMTLGADKTWLIQDYFNDLRELGKTTSLNIRSLKRIEDEHRKMSMERTLKGIPEIKVHNKYIKFSEQFQVPHELILTKDRLVLEGYDQHHCVATRYESINNGNCAIFSIPYQGKNYTLDLRIANRVYYSSEFRGSLNCDPPAELVRLVNDECLRISMILQPDDHKVISESQQQLVF